MKKTPLLLAAAAALAWNSPWAAPFFTQRVLQGVTFQVESANAGSINRVTVRTETPEGALDPITVGADGTLTNTEVADLNGDGYPEIYLYVTSVGSGSYGSLIAYASNRNRSLSPVYLPSIGEDPALRLGYMGHDEFAIGEGTLLRRFPIYRAGDTNAAPTGGTRQIQYRLEAGEAGWVLRRERVTDY